MDTFKGDDRAIDCGEQVITFSCSSCSIDAYKIKPYTVTVA